MTIQVKELVKRIIIAGYILVACALALFFLNWSSLPPELPWFYSLPWGESQLIKRGYLAIILLSEFLVWMGMHFWSIKNKSDEGELLISVLLGVIVSFGLIMISEMKIMTIFL
jgi:hypothetical protein